MSIKEYILEWDTIRKQPASTKRTAECTRLVHRLENTINAYISNNEMPWKYTELQSALLSESTGTQVATLLIIKAVIGHWPAPNISCIIISVINCLGEKYELYIQDVARTVLRTIFSTPWRCPFTAGQLVSIYNHLCTTLTVPPDDRDSGKREEFMYTIGQFFDQSFLLMPREQIPVSAENLVDRLRGSLLGMALGDAMGFLVEGMPQEYARRYVNDVIKTGKISQYGVHSAFGHGHAGELRYCKLDSTPTNKIAYRFGQYTDDTQCCRELLLSILESNGKFKAKTFASRLVSLFGDAGLLRNGTSFQKRTTGIVGYGTTTRDATQRLADGISWSLAGSSSSQGNGGCMRVAPLGVLYLTRPEYLAKVSSEQCAGTHSNSRARATAVLVAEATRLACENRLALFAGHDLEKYNRGFCKRIAETVQRYDKSVAQAVLKIPEWISDRREDLWAYGEVYANEGLIIKITTKALELGDKNWHGGRAISCYTIQTSLFAVCCFLSHRRSYFDTVCMAISAGGDTDTTAAIAGAISGAHLGISSIPKDLKKYITDNGNWDAVALNELCGKLKFF